MFFSYIGRTNYLDLILDVWEYEVENSISSQYKTQFGKRLLSIRLTFPV